MDLKQHNPNIQNSTSDELCKEANDIEQVQVKELCEISESSVIQPKVPKNNKSVSK